MRQGGNFCRSRSEMSMSEDNMKFWPLNINSYKEISTDYLDPETPITNNKEFGRGVKTLKEHLEADKFTKAVSCDLYTRLYDYAAHKLRRTGLSVEQFVIYAHKNPNERQDYAAFTSIPVNNIEELFRLAHPPRAARAKKKLRQI